MQGFWTIHSASGRLIRHSVIVLVTVLLIAGAMMYFVHDSRKEVAENWLSAICTGAAENLQQHLEDEVQNLNLMAERLERQGKAVGRALQLDRLSDYLLHRRIRALLLVDEAGQVRDRAGELGLSRIRLAGMRPLGTGYVDLFPAEPELARNVLIGTRCETEDGQQGLWLVEVIPHEKFEKEFGFASAGLRLKIVKPGENPPRPEGMLVATTTVPHLGVEIRAEATGNLTAAGIGKRAWQIVAIFTLLGGFLLFSALRSRRRIVEPLRRCVEAAERLAEGDLGTEIIVEGDEEIGEIFVTLQRIRDRFREVVGRLKMNASSLSAGSEELAAASQQLSQRVQEQASVVQESRATFEHMKEGISKTVANTQEARQQMNEVSESLAQLTELGARTNRTLQHFIEHAKEMSEITQLVDEMAFQTKLLALNAAVEAARAGEQGRGFAVVAGEIRNLAQRSADGARRIQEIVQTTLKEMEGAAEHARTLDESLRAISQNRERVVWIVDEIAAEMEEQATAIRQLNVAISKLDDVAQQNAAFAEELASSSEELAASAEELQEQVEFFRFEGQFTTTPVRVGRASKPQARPIRRVDRFDDTPAAAEAQEIKELTGFEEF